MGLEDRIIYSSDELIQNVEKALDRLKVLRYDPKYRKNLGDEFCNRFLKWEEEIRRRKDDPFTIAVVGDFKRGKSTFINALLGEEILTTDVTTETVTLNYLSYGEESTQAILKGGKRLLLHPEELKKERLETIMREAGEPVKKLYLTRKNNFLQDVTIIDTPGLGDALKPFDELVEECLLQADAVIYVYFVMSPLSQTEQLFLKTAVLSQKFTSLFLVGNRADVLESPDEFLDMENYLAERTASVFPEGKNYIISALDEICRKLKKARPNKDLAPLLAQHFDDLAQDIQKTIESRKAYAIPDRMQRLFQSMLTEAWGEITELEDGLSMSDQQAKEARENLCADKAQQSKELEKAKTHLVKLIADMQKEAAGWMTDFLQRLDQQLGELEHAETEDIQKHLSFYYADLLKEAINACLDCHREKLMDELSGISGGLLKNLTSGRLTEDYSFRFELDNRMWTKGDNLGFGVSLVAQMGFLGNLTYLLGSGAAGAMRSKEIKNQKETLLKQVSEQLPELRLSVMKTLKESYDRIAAAAAEQLTTHYTDKIKKTEQQVQLFLEISRKEALEKEDMRQTLDEMKRTFHDMESLVTFTKW